MGNSMDAPKVPVIPPVAFAIAMGCAVVLEWFVPLSGLFASRLGAAFGAPFILAGAAIGGSSVRRFAGAGTSFHAGQPSSALVETGFYRCSRNPMYIALFLVYLGVSAILTSLWAILILPLYIAYLRYVVIAREEAYLMRRFGKAYEDYQARVPRWL